MEFEEKTLSRREIYKGPIFQLVQDQVELPNGKGTAQRDLIFHNGAVCVLAVTPENKIVLVKQYRKAIEKVSVEIPAGKLEPGEDNKKLSAIRELKEETGYEATEDQLIKLFDVHVALGYSSEVITIFYVDGLEYAGEQNPDEDEFINLKKIK